MALFKNTECNTDGGVSEIWLINKNDIKSIESDKNCVITKLTIKRKYGKLKRDIFHGRNTSK